MGAFPGRFPFFGALAVARGYPTVPRFEKTPRKSTDLDAYVILVIKNFFSLPKTKKVISGIVIKNTPLFTDPGQNRGVFLKTHSGS